MTRGARWSHRPKHAKRFVGRFPLSVPTLCQSPVERPPAVPFSVRLSAGLFGHPSLRRAFGGFGGTAVLPLHRAVGRRTANVFFLEGVAAKGSLPRIWLTEPAGENATDGRLYSAVYPAGPDEDGYEAEELGERCFAEGLSTAAVTDGALRIQCFQAAEICFLHAAARGSVRAKLRLATIYGDDLCAGATWYEIHLGGKHPDLRARRLLEEAADAGSAEACWMLAQATGASRFWALRAVKLADETAWQQGNAWLAMAQALETQAQDLAGISLAKDAYQRAYRALGACVAQNNWHAKPARFQARNGLFRMAQELAFTTPALAANCMA